NAATAELKAASKDHVLTKRRVTSVVRKRADQQIGKQFHPEK
ncbi:MAG: imidazoleglycerol phosphate synthase glutamine amidotransferase subunit HisH, partial [Limisphaerales bacterium]